MNKISFLPQDYFNLNDFPFKDIFDGVENVWDVIPRIEEYTHGKLLQGKNCSVNPNTNIREGVILGDNVHVGFAVELKHCIIMNNSHIAHLNYVGDSVIGNDVNMGGGVMCANFRLDGQPVHVRWQEQKIATGLRKFSCVIGGGSKIGANAVINPGTILGKNCLVYPLVSVAGVHKSGEIIKSSEI